MLFFLPATLFAVLEERTVSVDFQRPAALHAAAVAPVDVGNDVGVAGIPLRGCGGRRFVGCGLAREFREGTGEALEVFGTLVFGHVSGECAADCDHAGGMGADQKSARPRGVGV